MFERPVRLAIVATHPIQYFVPQYRALATRPELKLHVFFASDMGAKSYFDKLMNVHIQWQMDLTSGYEYSFLPEADRIKKTNFFAMNNPSIDGALAAFKPDVIVVYGYTPLTILRTIFWGIRHCVPVMMISDAELLRHRAAWRRLAKNIPLRALVPWIAAFLTSGDNNERYWRSYGAPQKRMFRMPFSIDENAFISKRTNRAALRREWRKAHDMDEEEIVFLIVGKIYGTKRQMDLLDALEILGNRSRPCLRVVLAGDGPDRKMLEAHAKERKLPATFLGFINVDELPTVYAAADILIHTSERDAHPLALSEGACMGLPLIVSDRVGAVGPTDIAQPGRNALIYPSGDVHALADAMRALVDNPDLRKRMEAASLEVYLTQNTASSTNGLLDALRSVVKTDPN